MAKTDKGRRPRKELSGQDDESKKDLKTGLTNGRERDRIAELSRGGTFGGAVTEKNLKKVLKRG